MGRRSIHDQSERAFRIIENAVIASVRKTNTQSAIIALMRMAAVMHLTYERFRSKSDPEDSIRFFKRIAEVAIEQECIARGWKLEGERPIITARSNGQSGEGADSG